MFDNTNNYELKRIIRDDETINIASFTDGSGHKVESEIGREVANALFGTFVKKERNLKRSDERHLEHSELTEQTLHQRILNVPKSLEEEIDVKVRNEQLHTAIESLPKTQRRRLLLYFFEDYTLEQTAAIEGCSITAIHKSVGDGKENLKNILK